jgi:hypothetical protein
VCRALAQEQEERGLGEALDAGAHVPAAVVMMARSRPVPHWRLLTYVKHICQ